MLALGLNLIELSFILLRKSDLEYLRLGIYYDNFKFCFVANIVNVSKILFFKHKNNFSLDGCYIFEIKFFTSVNLITSERFYYTLLEETFNGSFYLNFCYDLLSISNVLRFFYILSSQGKCCGIGNIMRKLKINIITER